MKISPVDDEDPKNVPILELDQTKYLKGMCIEQADGEKICIRFLTPVDSAMGGGNMPRLMGTNIPKAPGYVFVHRKAPPIDPNKLYTGTDLAELRKQWYMAVLEWGYKFGVSGATISRMEREVQCIRPKVAQRIEKILGIHIHPRLIREPGRHNAPRGNAIEGGAIRDPNWYATRFKSRGPKRRTSLSKA